MQSSWIGGISLKKGVPDIDEIVELQDNTIRILQCVFFTPAFFNQFFTLFRFDQMKVQPIQYFIILYKNRTDDQQFLGRTQA